MKYVLSPSTDVFIKQQLPVCQNGVSKTLAACNGEFIALKYRPHYCEDDKKQNE